MPRIEVQGVGLVDFPDSMTDDEIVQAIENDILKTSKPATENKPKAGKPTAADLFTAKDPELLEAVVAGSGNRKPSTSTLPADSVMRGSDGKAAAPSEEASQTFKRVIEDNKQANTLKPGAKIVDGVGGVLEVGAKRGYAGLGRIEAGLIKTAADLTGSDTLAGVAQTLSERADEIESGTVLSDKPVEGFAKESIVQDLPEAGAGAVSSIMQTAPALGLAAVSGGSALPAIFATAGAQEYLAGREAGLSPEAALARAVPMASFEVIGEKVGGIDKLAKALKSASTGNGVADLGVAMMASAVREQPGEQITTAGQFATDLLPTIGLNQNATFDDYLQAAKDTALATMLQGGAMGAGGALINQVAQQRQAELGPVDLNRQAEQAIESIGSAQTVDQAAALATQSVQTPIGPAATSTLEPLNVSVQDSATGLPLSSDVGGGLISAGSSTDLLGGGGSGTVYAGPAGGTAADSISAGPAAPLGDAGLQQETGVAPGQVQAKVDIGTGDIVTSSGTPYRTEKTAEAALRSKGLEGQYTVRAVDGGFALTKTATPAAPAAEVPAFDDPVLPQDTSVESVQPLQEAANAAQTTETNLPDVGTQPSYADRVATVNAELQSRADEIEARTGQRPPELATASSAEEQSFAPLAEALKETFGTEVVPFSDTRPMAPDGLAYKGTTFINVGNLNKPAPFVAAHEFKHSMEQSSDPADREVAAWLEDNIMPLISEEGQREYAEKFLFKGMTLERVNADPELARELRNEMTADFMAKRMTDPKFMNDLAARDPVGFGGFVKKWIKSIDNLIKSLRGKKGLGISDIDKHITDLNKAKLIAQEALVRWRKNAMARQGETQASNASDRVQQSAKEKDLPTGKDAVELTEGKRQYKLAIEREARILSSKANLSEAESVALESAASLNSLTSDELQNVTAQAIATKKRYPKSEGWAPLELTGVTVEVNESTGERIVEPMWSAPGYAYNRPPGATRAPAKIDEAWLGKVSKEFTQLIKDIYKRAESGDSNAQIIIGHQTWYRNVAEVLRREFGGQGDLLADLLGATSPNTPVDTNWKFSVDILRRFTRGEFNKELSAFVQHIDAGKKASTFDDVNKIRQISGKLYGMNSVNAMKALADMWRVIEAGSAPKARNFALNLIGQSNMATIDVWAARMLRRAADQVKGASFPRLPPPAEKGVTGKWNASATAVTGEFGFGAAVLDKVSEALAKEGISVTPPDLQAIAWFAEKELWGKKGWTTVTGEGGSFEENLDANPAQRYLAGFSIQQGEKVPEEGDVSIAQARVMSMLIGDDSVIAARAIPTKGLYGGTVEESFDTEWTVRKGEHDPSMVMAEIARIAKENNQYDIFVSKVLGPNDVSPNARPGVEVYFTSEKALQDAQPILDAFVAKGQDGFTLVVDPRAKNKDGYIGVRLQYVPEISMRWDEGLREELLAPGGIEQALQEKEDVLDRVVAELSTKQGVAFASTVKYDTVVVGKENYNEYIDRIAGEENPKTGSRVWFGQPIRQGLEGAVARLQGEREQVDAGSVSSAGNGVQEGLTPARFSRKQTDTPEFKAWFGNSKVVDENGEPLVVYHGTNSDFTKFRTDRGAGGELGAGSYFTASKRAASLYAEGDGVGTTRTGAYVLPVYLALKNPYDATGVDDLPSRKKLIEQGFDGIIDLTAGGGAQYVVFSPNQIKSAIGNVGAFDPNNNDIRFSRKAISPLGETSQLVALNERAKAKESWGRHLDPTNHFAKQPGETAEVGMRLNNLYLASAKQKDAFDAFIKDLAEFTGTEPMYGPIKKRERTMEKVLADYNGDVSMLKDVLRATIATDSITEARQIYEVLSESDLVADVKGAVKNSLESGSDAGYRDAKVILNVNGVPAELIIAPKALLRAKEVAHTLYERARSLEAEKNTLAETMDIAGAEAINVEIADLNAKMAEIYLPAFQRAQSSSASLRVQGTEFSRALSELSGRLSGSNANLNGPTSATGMPSKSKNLVSSGSALSGESIDASSNTDSIPEGNTMRYSRKVDPKVKDWAVAIKNRKPAKPLMLIVAEPSKQLNASGVYRQVTMDESHVRHVYNKHAEIKPDDIASLPYALQNPRVAVARPDGSLRLIVDGRDAAGNPLAVALNNLNVGEGKGKIKVTEVNTMFGNEDSAEFVVRELERGNVNYLRRNEIDRLAGLKLVTEMPTNVEGAYSVGIRSPLPEDQSLPTTSPIANQPQVISVQTDTGLVNLRVNENAKELAKGVQFSRKQTETPEFKRWFGDSKVVDAEGKPLVVYHGTGDSFNEFEKVIRDAFFFSPDPKFASSFAESRATDISENDGYNEEAYGKMESGGANVIPVYLSVQNPFDPRNKEHIDRLNLRNDYDAQRLSEGDFSTIEDYFNEIKKAGFDGFYETEDDKKELWNIGVFSPAQIKSAIGNNGEFDPNNPDIRYARKQTTSPLALPEESGRDAIIRQWQNDQVRWKRQLDKLRETGGVVNDQNDVYQAMERMTARAMNRTEDFYKNNVTPVLERMRDLGVTMEEVGDYLYALHAKERNAAIKQINPQFAQAGYADVGGSGMSDQEADQIIADTQAKANFNDVQSIASEFRRWAEANLDGLVQGGLLTQAQAQDMRNKYPNYVPLKGFEDMEGDGPLGQGAGFSNAKDVVKRALGRGSRAGNPAVYIIHGVAEGMLAREKANVGRYLERLVQDNPDDQLWTIGQPEKEQVLGTAPVSYQVDFQGNNAGTFQTKRQAEQYIKLMNLKGATINTLGGQPQVTERDLGYDPDKEVRFLRDGKQVRIQLKDPLLARAYNNRGMEEIGTILRASASINSFLREMWTQKNPVFPFVNVIRDIPAGMLYATGEHGVTLAARLLRNTPAAWYAMWQQAGGKPVTNGMDKWVTEYRAAGGGIGFRMVGDVQSTMDKINRIEKQLGNKTIMQALAGGEIKEAGKRLLWKSYNNAVTEFIERVNIAFENMTRLAIYKAAREQNMSASEASRLAKNATVNFNRKGEKTPNLNAFYLFANAAMQDVAKNKRTIMDAGKKGQAQAILAAVASFGFITALLADDDDELDEENRNINNVRFKVGDKRVTIPLSYGLIGFSHYLGRSVAKALQGEDVSLQALRLASAFITNTAPVNPIPNPDRVDGTNAIVGMMPTPLEFPASVFLNRNSFGSDMRPDYNDNPDAYKAFRGTRGSVYADIAAFLNENTGGTTRESGWIDVSPETLKGMVHFTLGGTGKFVADTASTTKDLLDGGGVNPNSVPLLNRFVKTEDVTTYRARFYRQAGEAKDKLELYNKYVKDRNPEKRKELAPWVILGRRGNMMWKQMNAIRDQELKVERDQSLSEAERDAKLEALAAKQIQLSDRYHELYQRKVGKGT